MSSQVRNVVAPLKPKGGCPAPPRKSHVGFVHRRVVYVHGGSDENDLASGAFFAFDLERRVWEEPALLGDSEPLYDHKCASLYTDNGDEIAPTNLARSAFGKENKSYRANADFAGNQSRPEPNIAAPAKESCLEISREFGGRPSILSVAKAHHFIKRLQKKDNQGATEPRVYIFGGRNKEGEGNSALWLLRPEGSAWRKSPVDARGKPPRPRVHHSMCPVKQTRYFFVAGGTNVVPGRATGDEMMTDFFLFDLAFGMWVELACVEPAVRRFNAAVCEAEDGQVFLFGGMGEKNFVDGYIYKLTIANE